jgi:phosphatidylglycerol:prolipoprotein diacylglycerol transferase
VYPELFKIPFTQWSVPSYGLMLVIGFLAAVSLIRYMSRDIADNAELITNGALYSLIAGVVGARLFYVVHYFDNFRGDLLSIFVVWHGGLELFGGVFLAIPVIVIYLAYHKLPVRRYLDILAIGLVLVLAFGRVGCFLNSCCFGKPTNLPWAVRFPYHNSLHTHSYAYRSQVYPNLKRNRLHPQLELPSDFFDYVEKDGLWYSQLKPYEDLTGQQKEMVDNGPYRCLPVHPTQLYSSANGLFLCGLLYLFRRRYQGVHGRKKNKKLFATPGCTFALMLILYGITRFLIEFLRDDNPFTALTGLTVSQNICIALIVLGISLMLIFEKTKSKSRS